MELEETRVVLYGYGTFKKLLKEVDPDLRKEMDRTIRKFLNPVAKLAQQHAPAQTLSGWKSRSGGEGRWATRGWDQTAAIRGIKIRQGGKRYKGSATKAIWRIQNTSAAGSIYELAARKGHGKTPRGRTFVEQLRARSGHPSGLIWKAWDEKGGEQAITRSVIEIINRYENELDRRLSK